MAREWDSKMKSLANEAPEDFVKWLLPQARYIHTENTNLQNRNIYTDILYRISFNGNPYLLHMEFQKRSDSKMAQRLCEYNLLAMLQYGVPVYSFVLYLQKDRKIEEPPYRVYLEDGKPVHEFRFWSIKVWELEMEDLMQCGFVGVLPLVPLTKGGAQPAVIDRVVEILYDKGNDPKKDLLALTYGLAALVIEDEGDRQWVKRRFHMLFDILKDTWAFKDLEAYARELVRDEALKEGRQEGLEQGLEQGLEKGLEQGLEKGLEQGLEKGLEQGLEKGLEQGLEEAFYSLVEVRFPVLLPLARTKRATLKDHAQLQKLVVQMGVARSEEEACAFLSNIGK